MTGKNNLSVSEKFWIGILSTIICAIIGIAVSLFVPEVRDFFGIEEVKKSDKNMIESIILSADSVFEQGQYAAAIAKYETIPTYAKQDISDKLFNRLFPTA
jgi:galactitol-specific phosphotransferase system IIC component